ncbi:MAG TPA: AAA family ATPase, partial [Ignavibacteriaceae bacterium]|nr:AAA family ATPase [Ignavibacteriaceae bacterium]
MSPEQALGKPAGFQSDIWSFGIVFYEMLTGKLPFIHSYEEAIIYSIINEDPPSPSTLRSDIPSELEKIIMICLEKEEGERYSNGEFLLTDLKKIKHEIDSVSIRESYEKEQNKDLKKETEQKQATIVVMRINEYSEMLEKLGQENFVDVLEKCYEIVNRITNNYGGTINKTHVSDIVLYFGLPVTIENSAQKALKAAIEISESFYNLAKESKLPVKLNLNIGINTGMVIAGNISSGSKMEYTVIGDTIEIAAKLLESSQGQILVGPGTYNYTKNNFELKSAKSVSLKGKRDPIKVYSLDPFNQRTNKSSDVNRLIHSDMIGRTAELDKLESLLSKAMKGEGSIVSIIAEAGIGKSRLLSEFKKKDIIKQVILLEGKALSTAKNVSFHPVIDILRQWAEINENDNDNQAFSKLENSIQQLFNEEAKEIIPFIATLMGFQLKGEYEKRMKEVSVDSLNRLIQRTMRLLIVKGSQVKPVVFIIEDLHWADQSSIELLQSLLRLAENNKILFISSLRPNYQETGDRFISSNRERYSSFYTDIKLEPLSNKECEVLLQNLLNIDLPAQLKNSISKSTEGNPFFIEEVIRSLIDDNIIEIKNNQFLISKP